MKSEVGSRNSELGSRNSELGSRNLEVGTKKSEIRSPYPAFVRMYSKIAMVNNVETSLSLKMSNVFISNNKITMYMCKPHFFLSVD